MLLQPPPHTAFTEQEQRLIREQDQAAIFTYIHDRNLRATAQREGELNYQTSLLGYQNWK